MTVNRGNMDHAAISTISASRATSVAARQHRLHHPSGRATGARLLLLAAISAACGSVAACVSSDGRRARPWIRPRSLFSLPMPDLSIRFSPVAVVSCW